MITTAQGELQFKPEDQPALERRLRTYSFRSLQNPKKRAAVWLRSHPMDCIVWAAERARDDVERSSSDDEAEGDCCQLMGEGLLPECDKEALRTLSLVEDDDSELAQPGSNLEEDENANEENENVKQDGQQTVCALEKALQKCVRGALRHRQVTRPLHTRKKQEKEKRERED